MTSKVFTTGTVIDSEWLNDVNNATYAGSAVYQPAGTGAVATTVQETLREVIYADQYLTFQDALTAAAGKSLYVKDTYNITTGTILSIPSNVHIFGSGKILGPVVASEGVPTAYMKIQGTLGTSVTFGSVISEGTTTFTVANAFTDNDLLVLSNFPVDATDAYTEGVANWKGDKARSYANTSSSNLRQTRRRELGVIRSATGSAFELISGTQHAYGSTTALQFQKVIPTYNVKITGIELENIWLLVDYARDVTINCLLTTSPVEVRSSYSVNISGKMDQKDSGCLVDLHNSTSQFAIDLIGSGGKLPTDNALVRVDQVGGGSINLVATGTKGSMYACLVDTNFTENPLGYTDVPNGPLTVDITATKCATPNVFVTADPYAAAISNLNLRVASDVVTNDAVYLKGVNGATVQVVAKDARLRFDAVQNVYCRGVYTDVYESTFTDPRGAGTLSNSDLNLSLKSTVTLTLTSTTPPTVPCTCVASFSREGNFVHVDAYFNGVDTTGGVGDMSITGLPVPVRTGYRAVGNVIKTNLGLTAAGVIGIGSVAYVADLITGAALVISAGGGRYMQMSIGYSID